MNKKSKYWIVFFVLALIIAVMILPLDVDYKIKSVAKLLPTQQWILSRSNNDIITTSVDNLTGINNSFQVTSFQQGESMIMTVKENLFSGYSINKGDTLAIIYSSNQQEKLLDLNNQLEVLEAQLSAQMSGEKNAEIRKYEERLELARKEYEKQEKILIRKKKLYDKQLIAEEEFQKAQDELNILSKAIDVKKAELESSLTGVKSEEIDYLIKQINSIKSKISFIHNEINSKNYIVSPISGRLEKRYSLDTVLVVSNFNYAVALIPVEISKAEYLSEGDKVNIQLNNSGEILTGVIQSKQSVMQIINGEQCIIIMATVYNVPENIINGMITEAEIVCNQIPLRSYINRVVLN